MGKKEDTPLQATVKKDDILRKTLDKFIKTCETHLKKKSPDRRESKELYNSCKEQDVNLESHIDEVTNLDHEDEPSMKENKFLSKKKEELKKLNLLKEKLTKVEEKLKPDEVEEGEIEKENEDEESEEESEDEESEGDEEEGSEEEEESEEESEEEEPVVKVKKTESQVKEKKVESKVIQKTEVVTQKAARPSTSKPKQREEEEEDEDEDDDEEEESEVEVTEEDEESEEDDDEEEESEEDESEEETQTMSQSGTMRQYEALVDFKGEQKGDLSFHEGEILTIISARTDGWLEAENIHGKRGLVPITYLKVYNKYKDLETPKEESEEEESVEETDDDGTPRTGRTPRSGRLLWKNIRQAVKETSVTDVLQAMGAVPAGFRESTLAKLVLQDQYTMKAYLMPKLSQSCLSYRDIFINPQTNRIRARASRVLRLVQLVAARQIPAPGTGLDIKSRHVRICLFDGKNMLSNVHTIMVSSVDKDQRTWNFNTKVTDNMKSQEFGEFFIRSNTTHTDIGILFELCMAYERRSTEQSGEFSCGWVFLPLYDAEGKAIDFKSYDEFVHGGTPFEKGVDVDPSVGRKENASMLRSLMGGNKQPRLIFRLQQATKDQKDLVDTLPDVIVSSTVYIQYLSFYRQILVDAVIKDNDDVQSSDGIHSPILTTFPTVADQPDMMDVLRHAWADKLKTAKRGEKKDMDLKKELFKRSFMDSVYPLCHAVSLPPYKLTDHENHLARNKEMQRLLKMNKDKKFVACLLSPDAVFKPFDVNELSFNVINAHSVAHNFKL